MKNTVNIPHDHGQDNEELLAKMPEATEFIQAADIFTHLCDATRLKILWILCNSEQCVCNIAAAIGMSAPAVSHHLRSLRQAGIISNRRVGKEIYYTIADNRAAKLIVQMVKDVFV